MLRDGTFPHLYHMSFLTTFPAELMHNVNIIVHKLLTSTNVNMGQLGRSQSYHRVDRGTEDRRLKTEIHVQNNAWMKILDGTN